MFEKKFLRRIVFFLAALASAFGFKMAEASARLEDDFYDFINAEWLGQATIRPDRGSAAAITEMEDKIRDILARDLKALAASGEPTGDALMDAAAGFYKMSADFAARDRGWAAAKKDYDRIGALENIESLNAAMYKWITDGMPLPFGFGVEIDYSDATRYRLVAGMAGILLGDRDYYEEGNEIGERLRPIIRDYIFSLFRAAGLDETAAAEETERAMEFDAMLASYDLTSEKKADVSVWNNPEPFADFAARSANLDFGSFVPMLVMARPETINVLHVKFFDAFDEIYNAANFGKIKSWMKAHRLMDSAACLGLEFLTPLLKYSAASMGAEEPSPLEELPYVQTRARFGDVIGKYYGEKYFGEEAKRQVTDMIKSVVAVYENRLRNNPWLGEETKATAIRKLGAMTIRAGYPDRHHPQYKFFRFTPPEKGGTLYGAARDFGRAMIRYNFSLYGTTVDRALWSASAIDVNAYYKFSDNSINIPAGILQAPFYSQEQSASANFGGIGIVVGHEISHAFDTNGGRFDENGNYRDWWTDADYAEFEKRARAMVELFDGVPYANGKVNGELTKSENIADAGGVSCALEIAKSLSDANLEEFFASFAAIWRMKTRPELEAIKLTQDAHAPPKLRVNIQLSNADDFYRTYNIKQGDGMYIPPEKRVEIW